MQIKQLRYLLKIVECGSITKAASQLYTSQPSLTKSISSLEQEYGITLFSRKSHGVELTVEGKEFLRYARKVIAAADALDNSFASSAENSRAELFIASHQFDFIYDALLHTYRDCCESPVHFNLIETDRSDVVTQVLEGHADIGFFVRNTADSKNKLWNREGRRLDFQVLDQSGNYICVGPSSPFYNYSQISYEDVSGCLQIRLDMEPSAKQDLFFDNNAYSHTESDKMVFFNTISACLHFLQSSDAVLFASKWILKAFDNTSIRTIPVITDLSSLNELVLVKRTGEPLTEVEETFIGHVKNLFRRC